MQLGTLSLRFSYNIQVLEGKEGKMHKRPIGYIQLYILAIFILFPWPSTLQAADFQQSPYNYFFGNHIDTHQETRLKVKKNKPASLQGFFYVIFPGGIDNESGLAIARHPRGASEDEACGVDVDCVVGWLIDAVPGEAKFLYHQGVNGDDHPVWLVNRIDIPQPGSFTHFHWITSTSTDSRAPTVPDACDKIDAGDLENLAPSAVNVTCPGWFLQIRAVEKFAFEHGGEIIPVYPGIDNATHLNLVTNYAEVQEITPTR